jgi:chromosomal replication initiator protein
MAPRRLWEAALPRIREKVGERNFTIWIEPLRVEDNPDVLSLAAPDATVSASVNRHFVPLIARVLTEVGGKPCRVEVSVGGTPAPAPAETRALPAYDDATFERFVVGDSNREAYGHAVAVAGDRFHGQSPLVIYGGVGLGKTHLARATANVRRVAGDRGVVCESSTDFVGRSLEAMGRARSDAWDRATAASLLILDDIHFLAPQASVQEALLELFATLHRLGTPIVLTSDRPPGDIPNLHRGLRSRFENGVLTEISPPEFDLRRRILLQKASDRGIDLPQDVASFLADRIVSSGRTLEGALTRVCAYAAGNQAPSGGPLRLTRPLAAAALRIFETPQDTVTPDVIASIVAEARGLTPRMLTSKRRTRDITLARQLAMYLCRTHSRLPLTAIATRFGRRDHTTVLHACEVMERKRATDPAFDELVVGLERQIRTRTR